MLQPQIRILVVDDLEDVREMLSHLLPPQLRQFSVSIVEMPSGNSAITLLKRGEEFDFIISDYFMDDGSGVDLLLYLSEHHPNLPIVILTNHPQPSLPANNALFLGVIDKSRLDILAETISIALGRIGQRHDSE